VTTLSDDLFSFLLIARTYANALLATLNSRALIRPDRHQGSSHHRSEPQFAVGSASNGLWSEGPDHSSKLRNDAKFNAPIALTVTTERNTFTDGTGTPPMNDKPVELSSYGQSFLPH
jgi:hypothetical protein